VCSRQSSIVATFANDRQELLCCFLGSFVSALRRRLNEAARGGAGGEVGSGVAMEDVQEWHTGSADFACRPIPQTVHAHTSRTPLGRLALAPLHVHTNASPARLFRRSDM